MNRRTLLLIELREIRDLLERAYDKLREVNCYALPKTSKARQHLADSLQSLKDEIDAGEDHNNMYWPGSSSR